jgi:hypothetical protein
MPLFISWAWGLSTIYTVLPTAVGFFKLIVFTAVIIGWYTYKHLQHRAWLMQGHVLHKCAVVLLCILVYCASTVFTDPTVYHGGQSLVSQECYDNFIYRYICSYICRYTCMVLRNQHALIA